MVRGQKGNPMKRMTAKYAGTCGHCHAPIKRGEEIGYDRRLRIAYHDKCVHAELQANPRTDCGTEDDCCGSAFIDDMNARACGL